MKMTGQKEIDSAGVEQGNGADRASDQIDADVVGRRDEWMVRHHNFETRAGVEQVVLQRVELGGGDPSIFPGEGACGVQTDHDDLVVAVNRIDVFVNERAIAGERSEKTSSDIEERHVVVSRDDELRGRKFSQEGFRGGELGTTCALGEIA